ncbi:hypothetical protein KXD40_006749 [Peronospora effusa]|nr:hypothetical protein KXD40_006749 [Peronospora effusa]
MFQCASLTLEKKSSFHHEESDGFVRFEAKCFAAGRSRVYECRTDGDMILYNSGDETKFPLMK